MKATRQESTPFVAWNIVRCMLESFDDSQLRTMAELVAHERRARAIRPGPGQRELFTPPRVEVVRA